MTTLEVGIIGHVLCAFGMYFFWYHKTLNVEDPIVIKDCPATSQLLSLHSLLITGREIYSFCMLADGKLGFGCRAVRRLLSFVTAWSKVIAFRHDKWFAPYGKAIPACYLDIYRNSKYLDLN